jgi:hypothetical protein
MSESGSDLVASEADRLDLERRRLECDKLRVEIAQASAPWWTRAGYIGSLVPIVIAIAGFATGLATGFFDTERQELKAEIAGLTTTRNELRAASEALQKTIDDSYLIVYATNQEARYAISHVKGLALDEIEPKVASAVEKLSGEEQEAVRRLLDGMRIAQSVASAAEEELAFVTETLQKIPASDWAKSLKAKSPRGLYIPGRVLLETDDGSLFYDPIDGRSYKPNEIGQP